MTSSLLYDVIRWQFVVICRSYGVAFGCVFRVRVDSLRWDREAAPQNYTEAEIIRDFSLPLRSGQDLLSSAILRSIER